MLIRAGIAVAVVAVGATVTAGASFNVMKLAPLDDRFFSAGLHAAPLTIAAPFGDTAGFMAGQLRAVETDAAVEVAAGTGARTHVPISFSPPASSSPDAVPDVRAERPRTAMVDGAGGGAASPARYDYTHRTKRGDTLGGMLLSVGVGPEEAEAAIGALRQQFDPRRLRVGQDVTITLGPKDQMNDHHRLDRLSFEVGFPHRMVVSRRPDGSFGVSKDEIEVGTSIVGAMGVIRSSLFADGGQAGVPVAVLHDLLKIYSWDVDFQRDVHPGDSFALLYERHVDGTGAVVGSGRILAAVLTLSGQRTALFRYTTEDGDEDYYDEDGRSVRKALLKTPIDGARLSSGFGMRRHPVLGYSRMHRGVDFAAPPGTPIFAAGDGTVEMKGGKRGYGRYVKLRHRAGYATAYAHMSRYAKNLRAGTRVKQGDVIGYVGSSGLATGPHLHYEILIDGQQVNPIQLEMPAGRELAGQELRQFRAAVDEAVAQLSQITRDSTPTHVVEASSAL